MRLAEYLLAEDNRLDLADSDRAKAWFLTRPWQPTIRLTEKGPDAGMKMFWGAAWRENLFALRSLCRRLTGKRVKHPYPDSLGDRLRADRILRQHLSLMQLHVETVPAKDKAPHGLSRKTFIGVLPWPTIRSGDGTRQSVPPTVDYFFDPEVFWQAAFFSLVAADAPNFCSRCGRMLPARTRTGRLSKQRLCAVCRWRNWRTKQPIAEMRERWKRHKREWRTQS